MQLYSTLILPLIETPRRWSYQRHLCLISSRRPAPCDHIGWLRRLRRRRRRPGLLEELSPFEDGCSPTPKHALLSQQFEEAHSVEFLRFAIHSLGAVSSHEKLVVCSFIWKIPRDSASGRNPGVSGYVGGHLSSRGKLIYISLHSIKLGLSRRNQVSNLRDVFDMLVALEFTTRI